VLGKRFKPVPPIFRREWEREGIGLGASCRGPGGPERMVGMVVRPATHRQDVPPAPACLCVARRQAARGHDAKERSGCGKFPARVHYELSNSARQYVLSTNSGTVGRRTMPIRRSVSCPQCLQQGSVANVSPSSTGSLAGGAASAPAAVPTGPAQQFAAAGHVPLVAAVGQQAKSPQADNATRQDVLGKATQEFVRRLFRAYRAARWLV
jgi:hypothetical protein